MTRLVSPDRACVEVDVGPRRYRGNRIDVTDQRDAAALKEVGYFDPGPGGVTRADGYVCGCGFHGFFKTCGRCGGTAHRQGPPGS